MSTSPPIRRAFTMAVLAAAIIPAAIRARRLAQAQFGAAAPLAQPAVQPPPPPRTASHMRRLPTEIADEEYAAITQTHRDNPPTRDQLVGLALSGGGIRSATFGLGVLEALKKADLLKRIHYLSTVSGGGYIGGWFSANCKRAEERREQAIKTKSPRAPEPRWWEQCADWGRSIDHLRRYSNYLSPEVGFFSADTWSMFTVWLRNALLVQWTVIMAVACILLVPRLLPKPFVGWYSYHHWRWLGVFAFVLAVVGIAGNQQRVSRGKPAWIMRADHWLYAAAVCVVCLVTGVGYAYATGFDPFGGGVVPLGSAVIEAGLVVIGGYTLLLVSVALYGLTRDGAAVALNYTQAHVQWLIVVPLLTTGFFVGAVLWAEAAPQREFQAFATFGELFMQGWRLWPFPLAVVFFSIWVLSFSSVERIWAWGSGFAALLSPFVCVIALHAMLCAILLLLRGWAAKGDVAHAFVLGPPLVLFAFSIAVVVLIGMVGRQSSEGVREWWSRLGAWLLIYGAAWTAVTVVAVYGPSWMYTAFTKNFWTSVGGALTWVGTVGAGLFAGHSEATGKDGQKKGNVWLGLTATIAPYLFIAGLLVGVSTVIDLIITASDGGTWWGLAGPAEHGRFWWVSFWALVVSSGTLCLLGWRIDINEFSLNAFYRNRLVRCFLGATRSRFGERQPQNFTGFDDLDDLPLCNLLERDRDGKNPPRLYGPLPILNCALNLGGAGDLSLHTRHSASFTLTPFRAGSDYRHESVPAPRVGQAHGADGDARTDVDDVDRLPQVGFVETSIPGSASSRVSLGRAIAVSGAAASPNMGYHTSPVVSFLLTVFNLRLGWWFPRPDTAAAKRWTPKFSLPYMFTELFGGATFRSRFLMVSDGGHFENLGAYELIKRGCRLVIISDAECDPGLAFDGLGTLIRMCEVDFGVQITIDVHSLRLGGDDRRWSPHRAAVGTIVYPDGPQGTLVYLKAAMTGHEPTPVLQYKTSHATFPHETTGDQFYSEDQFESYRRLGLEVTSKAFEAALAAKAVTGPASMIALGGLMAKTLAPTLVHADRFTAHAAHLVDLWDKIRENPDLDTLDSGLVKGGLPPGPSTLSRAEFYTCVEMIQLMENVYIDLHLDSTWEHADNGGWKELFLRWSTLPQLKSTWKATHRLFGERFRFFARRFLDLKDDETP
jgi:Patatin-like phospholipase